MKILKWNFQSVQTFFGLGPNYRPILHDQVFDLVYWGKGGFSWSDVYNMPVWLRVFYINKISKIHKKEKEDHDRSMKKSKSRRR